MNNIFIPDLARMITNTLFDFKQVLKVHEQAKAELGETKTTHCQTGNRYFEARSSKRL
jgi:hypothetical protein